MTIEELYKLQENGDIGFASVFDKGSDIHTDYIFPMTAENIANFIGKYAYKADKIIMTDLCDTLICESTYGGIISKCPDQNLCKEINAYLIPIQQGTAEPKDFPIATRQEMEMLWDAEEVAVMHAEFGMM